MLADALPADVAPLVAAGAAGPVAVAAARHAPGRASATPSLIGGYIPIMLANGILVEAVFGIPGI
jgi:hypothetical protein